MPDVDQHAESDRDPAQEDCNEPRRDHQQRDRRDVDAEQIDLDELQVDAPVSK